MSEIDKVERIFKILSLLSSNIKYSIKELSDVFSISERSIRRYIAALREVGFIIPRPTNGRYYVEKNSPKFKELSQLLHFSEEEAFILTKAIHSIDDVNILKTNLVKKLYALYDFDRVAVTVVKRENGQNVHTLIEAIKNKKQVILRQYQSSNSKLVRDRLIEPFDFTTNYIYVWAYDPESRSCKTYKTSRIAKVELLPSDWKFADFHKKQPVDVFRISGEPIGTVKLKLTLRAKNLLIEEYPLAEKFLICENDTLYQFETEICGWEGVGRFVLGLFDEIEVLAPKAFQKYLTEKIENFQYTYAK